MATLTVCLEQRDSTQAGVGRQQLRRHEVVDKPRRQVVCCCWCWDAPEPWRTRWSTQPHGLHGTDLYVIFSLSVIEECRHYFNIALPSELLCMRAEKFLLKLNANCG